jgi:hypothetical protein
MYRCCEFGAGLDGETPAWSAQARGSSDQYGAELSNPEHCDQLDIREEQVLRSNLTPLTVLRMTSSGGCFSGGGSVERY